jgi:hypothetical protein
MPSPCSRQRSAAQSGGGAAARRGGWRGLRCAAAHGVDRDLDLVTSLHRGVAGRVHRADGGIVVPAPCERQRRTAGRRAAPNASSPGEPHCAAPPWPVRRRLTPTVTPSLLRPPRWVIRFRGLNFPIYLFSPETAPHGAGPRTPLHLASTHPPPHPKGRSPHPQTHVGDPHLWVRTHQRAYMALGMGGQNGCPAGNLRGNGPNTRNCATLGHATPPRPHPPPHPKGWFPHP